MGSNLLYGQDDFTLYNMNLIPQASYVNPAIMPNDQIFIGFPVLGNINLGVSNTGFSYNDLFKATSSSDVITQIITKLPKNNYFNFKTNVDLISFGYRSKKMYFYFSATEKVSMQFRYPTDFLKFAWFGNGDLLGQTLNFNFGLEAIHYRNYGLLASRQINNKLLVGARFSYLYGMENIHTALSDISLLTDENTYALTAKSNIEINTSGLSQIDIAKSPYTTYHLGKKNRGFGLDLGGEYKLTNYLTLTASVVNLGYIKWNDDIKNYKSQNPNASYTFDGVNLNQVFSDSAAGIDNTLKGLQDSILNKFKIVENYQPYKTTLPPKIFVGGILKISKNIKASLLIQSYFFDGKPKLAVSAGFTASPLEWVDLGLTYSAYKGNYKNVGLAISLWPGGSNLHLITDNILGAIKYKDAKNLNVRFGFSLVYGKYFLNDDMDGDLVADDIDKCPRQAGKQELGGCPDRDGDLIIDSEDDCPGEFGTKAMNGCPDRDGDRVIDRYDDCPDVSGEVQFKGCPDRDHDGIKDSEDKCPTDAGTTELKGCPDKDGDGVGDSDDLCPDVPGTRNNRGCPVDTDGDGIADINDKCPDVMGEKNNGGCPDIDSDGDGVNDKDDLCPLTTGELSNNGCPNLNDADKSIAYEAQINLKFKDNTSEIIPTSYASLEVLATWMNTSKANLVLKAHTSNEESESINLALSKERSEAVKKFLVAKNVNPTKVTTEFYGSSKPIGDNNTPDGREKNNRVEFVIAFK